jgi:DNA-binding beta-propeller fold protein YncE
MITRYDILAFAGVLAACGASPQPGPVSHPALATALPSAPVQTAASAAPNASTSAPPATKPSPTDAPLSMKAELLALPGATGPLSLDLIFYEPQKARVWVPAGGTGSVAVFDTTSHAFSLVAGFKTMEREAHGKKRIVGPSAGAIGEGYAYIGNRATQEVCAVDLTSLKLGSCLKLADATDAVGYVAATREVWVTTPHTQSLVVLDASKGGMLRQKSVIKLSGDPECYAIDDARGVFLTNLEDKGSTLAIDLKTHAIKDTWNASCSSEGPRGVAVDSARGLLLVACTDHVQALDLAHGGVLLGKLETGGGVDNIDYVAATGLLYAAAGKDARLTVAHLSDHGEFTVMATGETAPGARNAVADAAGNAYVADSQGGRLLVLPAKQR